MNIYRKPDRLARAHGRARGAASVLPPLWGRQRATAAAIPPAGDAASVPLVQGDTAKETLSRDAFLRRTLAAGDLLSAAFALVVGIVVVGGSVPTPMMAVALPLVVLVSKVTGLYDRDELLLRRTTLDEAPALFQAATAYSLLIWIGESFFVSGNPLQHLEVIALWALLFASMLLARALARRLVRDNARAERCLVLGDGVAAERLRRSFEATPYVHAEVVGRLPIEAAAPNGNGASPDGPLPDLRALLESQAVDRVVIAQRSTNADHLLDAVRAVKGLGVKVSVVPRLFEVAGSSASVDEIDGLLLLGLPAPGLSRSSTALKRAVDIAGATALLVLLGPLIVSAAIAVRATSRGPVIVRRPRIGRDGRTFEMLAIRTTTTGPSGGSLTSAGRALRPLAIEQLPVLLNVLRGDMSLVGPRPEPAAPATPLRNGNGALPELVAPTRAGAAQLRPGITGLWRTRGSALAPGGEHVKLELDYLYAADWSLWLDVRIMLRTIPTLVEPRPLESPNGRAGAPRLGSSEARLNGHSERQEVVHPGALSVSAVVPATNSPATLDACVAAIREAREGPDEIVVVKEAPGRGPSSARNEGALRASGEVLVFVDADVLVHRDAFARIREAFARRPDVAAVFGSYDKGLARTGRVATFRNALHHHVHQNAPGAAGTFWSGLGAVRREDFLACGGFDADRFPRSAVEDIELGMRLRSRGARIVLNPKIECTHLKDWGLWDMVRTDFSRRGVPWIGLLLRNRGNSSSELNLGWRHRLSAIASLLVLSGLTLRRPHVAIAAALWLLGVNAPFYALLARQHGLGTSAAGVGLHFLHHLVSVAAVPAGLLAHARERGRS